MPVKHYAIMGSISLMGFIVGYAIGKETRAATPSHIETELSDGVFTIKANVSGAVNEGVTNFLDGVFG